MLAHSQTPTIPPFQTSAIILHAQIRAFYYDTFLALRQVDIPIYKNSVTALIGPSGCGKSTLLRCFNRLNELIANTRLDGKILYYDRDIYHPQEDAVALRRRIGMIFQKPNPLPNSIYNNVAYGPRVTGYPGDINELVERSLRQAFLWDEVKDRLKDSALALSGGQQQRLCIARTLAVQPEIILMDEPCASLDPFSVKQIEQLIEEFKTQYTIAIVTHNLPQAARVSDMTAFFNVEMREGGRTGELIEYDRTTVVFENPKHELTQQYVEGRFG